MPSPVIADTATVLPKYVVMCARSAGSAPRSAFVIATTCVAPEAREEMSPRCVSNPTPDQSDPSTT